MALVGQGANWTDAREANVTRRFGLSWIATIIMIAAGCGSSSSTPSDAAHDGASSRDVALGRDGGADVARGDAPADAVVDAPAPDLARPDGGVDAAAGGDVVDAPAALDGVVDASAGLDGPVVLAQIAALLASRCVTCHNGTGPTAALLDMTDKPDAAQSLYQRLLGPIHFEPFCGEPDGGVGIDAGPHHAIVPDNLDESFLYLKINGQQPSPGTPPARCGVRMPRVVLAVLDGGAVSSVGCDQADGGVVANCLTAEQIALVRNWILQGAPQ